MGWPSRWLAIESDAKPLIADELGRELSRGHVLYCLSLDPIARADGRDDFRFAVADGRVAEVHLTFANHPERPPWPLYETLDAWKRAKEADDDS